MQYLEVKDFDRFQHYKDRHPPWIKLHYTSLSNYEITSLPDAAQGQLWKFWLLASRHGNRIPYDAKYLRREIKPSGRLYLRELLASGLLAVCKHDASAPLSLARADARSREAEGETEAERETDLPRARPAGRDLVLAHLSASRRHAMEASMALWERGEDLPAKAPRRPPTPAELDKAYRDVAASIDPGTITAAAVRGFIARAMAREPDGAQPLARAVGDFMAGGGGRVE